MPRDTSGNIPLKEHNNHKQGRTGSKVDSFEGPAVGGAGKHSNPTMGGGINRATKGKGGGGAA